MAAAGSQAQGFANGDRVCFDFAADRGLLARIGDEVTVKRLQRSRQRNKLLLVAENANYAPIEVDLAQQDFQIEGLSVGIIRQSI